MSRQFSDVSSTFGAPMGRHDENLDPYAGRIRVFRVNVVDGDYDDGGACWGFGMGTLPLYCARDADGNDRFYRADTRDAAKAAVTAEYTDARFFR